MACRWEGNHRSGAAAAMHHRLQWFIHLRAHSMRRMTSTLPTLLVVSQNMKPMNINKCHIIIQWLNSPETQNLQWNTVNDFWRSTKVWRFLYAENGVIFQKHETLGYLCHGGIYFSLRSGVPRGSVLYLLLLRASFHNCIVYTVSAHTQCFTNQPMIEQIQRWQKKCQLTQNTRDARVHPTPVHHCRHSQPVRMTHTSSHLHSTQHTCTHDPHLITPTQHTAHLYAWPTPHHTCTAHSTQQTCNDDEKKMPESATQNSKDEFLSVINLQFRSQLCRASEHAKTY